MKTYIDVRKRSIIGLILTFFVNITYGEEPVPMRANEVELFSKLYRIYPNTEFGQPVPLVRGKITFDTRIWSMNAAEECTLENFDPVCRGQVVYITVSDGEIGGRSYGVLLGKAFGWEVLEIAYQQNNHCVLISLAERDVEIRYGKMVWARKVHMICISPEGLVS